MHWRTDIVPNKAGTGPIPLPADDDLAALIAHVGAKWELRYMIASYAGINESTLARNPNRNLQLPVLWERGAGSVTTGTSPQLVRNAVDLNQAGTTALVDFSNSPRLVVHLFIVFVP